ncbi:uncharacterized protein [Hoplias malabaricus]|uniref:uncharacterized protein n=1 Tax=Hoplias malabaricus TaxID=27720 RepID=UPI0034621E8F
MAEKALENEVMDEESFFLENICASSIKVFTVLQSLRNDQLHMLEAQSGESISRELLNRVIVGGKNIVKIVCHIVSLKLEEILDIECQRIYPASLDSCFTESLSALRKSEAVAGSYSHLEALFGITEQTVLRSVQERMKKCVFGGFSNCPQLTAALVSEVIHAINAAVQKTMVKEAWGCSKPLFCRHPFKSCTQTGNELVSSVMARVEDLIQEQAAGNSGAPETDMKAAVAEVLWAIKDQIRESETSEEAMFSLDLIEFILNNTLMVKDQERSCSPASDRSWSSDCSDLDCQSVELPDFASEFEHTTEEEGKSWVILRKQGHDDRDRVLMSTLVDTVLKGLGLKGTGYVNTLQNTCAAYRRLQDLINEGCTSTFFLEIDEKVQDAVTQRMTSLRNILESVSARKNLLNSIAGEFMADFADEISTCLFLSLFVPRPDSSDSDNKSLATTCSTTPEGYSSEKYSSEVSDDKAPQKTSNNIDSKPVISWAALTLCIQTILRRIQEVASTDVQKSQLAAVIEQHILNLTYSVWTILDLATVVRLVEDEHTLPELHHSIVDEAYEELLNRMGSVSDLVEAVYTRSELLCRSLAVSIMRAILRADPKYICPPGDAPETPAFMSSPSHDPVSLLLLCILARSEPAPVGCCWKKRSSNSQKEDLMERVLLEVSTDSGSERIQTALRGTFDELRQRFGEEGLLRMVMNPHDSSVTRALTRALDKLLGGSRAEGEPEDAKKTTKKLRNIFSSLRKLSLFKTKSKDGKKSGSEDGDPDELPSCSTQNAAPSQEKKQKKESIFSRMFSSFRKPAA